MARRVTNGNRFAAFGGSGFRSLGQSLRSFPCKIFTRIWAVSVSPPNRRIPGTLYAIFEFMPKPS